MDKTVARAQLDAFIEKLRKRTYSELCELLDKPQCEEVRAPDGKSYQIEFEAFWDESRKAGGNLRVIASVDDGTFLASVHPMSDSFIMAPDGSFVGE